MPEIASFVNHGATTITPAVVESVLRHLPQWKLEFTQIREPLFPHLAEHACQHGFSRFQRAADHFPAVPFGAVQEQDLFLLVDNKDDDGGRIAGELAMVAGGEGGVGHGS